MNRKICNRLVCFLMSAAMFLGVSFADKNEVTAAGTYDATLTITSPVPGKVPQSPVISGSLEYEMLGYFWEDGCYYCGSDDFYMSDTEFMDWYAGVADLLGESLGNNALETFEDGHKYKLSAFAKVSDFSAPMGTEGEVTIIDSVSSEEIDLVSCYFMSASSFAAALPEGVSLPSCLTKNDSFVVFGDTPAMICAPEGHEHTSGEYRFDDEHHWKICSECEAKLHYTTESHYVKTDATEPWTVTKKPTATETGLWEKKCSDSCGYDFDSIVVPCLNDQTIVSSYEELRDALAKGGKQWITIEKEYDYSDWLVQEDTTGGNTLKVDDPNADITIDMNGCAISRQTGTYDSALFEIKAGKLRILSKKYNSSNNDYNLNFKSFSSEYTLFKVYENGSLRVTNVSGTLTNGSYGCANSSIISEGNLQIDGGIYINNLTDFDPEDECPAASVLINGGKAVINGGQYDASGCAVAVKGGDVTINGGEFSAWDKAVYISGDNTTVNIYDGKFDKTDTTYDWCQDYGVYCNGGVLNVYDGDFYGEISGLCGGYHAGSINIYDGFFRLRGTGGGDWDGAFSFCLSKTQVKIYNGIFKGSKGINGYYDIVGSIHNFTLADYLVNGGKGSTVTDDGAIVDISTKTDYFGSSYLIIKSNLPYITRQPESVEALTGDDVVFKVKAENATGYIWYICDADDETGQPYSWEDLKKMCDISGENTNTLVIKNVKSWFDNKKLSCAVCSDNGRVYSQDVYLSVAVKGDVNSDGVLNVSDIVMMKKYLVKAGELTDWELGDVNQDGIINVFDLCLMRRMLLS